jgi:hypothetical protein
VSEANKTQVGGSHYKVGDKPEHWDLAIMYQWDPFQYQITKYVMRWKDKHDTREKRLEDLKKARHFLDKYIEEADKYDPQKEVVTLQKKCEEDDLFSCEGWCGDNAQLYKCRKCGSTVCAPSLEGAQHIHGSCANRAYVNQG